MQADTPSVSILTVVAVVISLSALAADIALLVQTVVYLLRGVPGSIASTRARRAALLVLAGLHVLAAIAIGLLRAATYPRLGIWALFSGAIALVPAALLIQVVVRANRASRRQHVPRSPPDA